MHTKEVSSARRLLLVLMLVFSIPVSGNTPDEAQKTTYKEEINIQYRSGELSDYMVERCLLDVYYPENLKNYSTVVWFHGGGLKAGNKFIPEALKNQGIAIIAANYRLSPNVKCPAYVEDAAAALAWAFNNIERYGGDKSKIFVSGHSAGGYLTSMVGLDKSYLGPYGIDADDIAALLPFSGHTITHFTIRDERGIEGTQVVVDEMAPIHHIRKDAPPLILITGDRELEMLGRYEENAYMYRMMKVIGHEKTQLLELDGFDHGGMAKPAYYILLEYIKRSESN